jgi:hypothetical protein
VIIWVDYLGNSSQSSRWSIRLRPCHPCHPNPQILNKYQNFSLLTMTPVLKVMLNAALFCHRLKGLPFLSGKSCSTCFMRSLNTIVLMHATKLTRELITYKTNKKEFFRLIFLFIYFLGKKRWFVRKRDEMIFSFFSGTHDPAWGECERKVIMLAIQGCQIYIGHAKTGKNKPNGHKLDHVGIK